MLVGMLLGLGFALPVQDGVGRSAEVLGEKVVTEHFLVHYRPGSRAGASADRVAYLLEKEFAAIVARFALAGRLRDAEPFHVFVYDSVEELAVITEVSGAGGFASGREVHVPWDNEQTLRHELVHVLAAAMDSTGPEARNLFFAEGLANAYLEFVTDVPVHGVAAYEKQRGSLPPLAEVLGAEDFYAYLREHPDFNGYDVGGSYLSYLLARFGPGPLMDYYHGKPLDAALGISLEEAEAGWHAFLDQFPLRPELRTLLAERHGDGGEFTAYVPPVVPIPDEVVGEAEEWFPVQEELAAVDEIGTWEFTPELARCRNSNGADWSISEVPGQPFGDCVVRVQVQTVGRCWGILLGWGTAYRAMVLGQGSFVYHRDRAGVAFTDRRQLAADESLELVLQIQGGVATVWLDGAELLHTDVDPPEDPQLVQIGVVGGTAEFRELSVRPLD